MYATDFFDQVEHRILPASGSGTIVLADRFIFTLIARGVVRGINRDYMSGVLCRDALLAALDVLARTLRARGTAFGREFIQESSRRSVIGKPGGTALSPDL